MFIWFVVETKLSTQIGWVFIKTSPNNRGNLILVELPPKQLVRTPPCQVVKTNLIVYRDKSESIQDSNVIVRLTYSLQYVVEFYS
jgi:hypothetical protein